MVQIIAICDPCNARMHYNGQEILKKEGTTPTMWVIGEYASIEEAKEVLWGMALEDASEHRASLSREDDESVAYMKQMLIDDGLSESDIEDVFSWYKGEGVYSNDGHEAVLLKGGDSYSYDVMTYRIE